VGNISFMILNEPAYDTLTSGNKNSLACIVVHEKGFQITIGSHKFRLVWSRTPRRTIYFRRIGLEKHWDDKRFIEDMAIHEIMHFRCDHILDGGDATAHGRDFREALIKDGRDPDRPGKPIRINAVYYHRVAEVNHRESRRDV